MNDKDNKDMNNSAQDRGPDGGTNSQQLTKAKSKDQKKDDTSEFINTSSHPQDPRSDLHNITNS